MLEHFFSGDLMIVTKAIVFGLSVLFSAFVGYLFGAAKSFREEKQKAYGELLPPIIKMAYSPQSADETEFSRALMKLWLYGSKKVTLKMEHAVSILHHPTRGNATKAFQEAIVEMRADIQIWPWQRIKPEEVNHLYTSIKR
jgi:hypothetical protein